MVPKMMGEWFVGETFSSYWSAQLRLVQSVRRVVRVQTREAV